MTGLTAERQVQNIDHTERYKVPTLQRGQVLLVGRKRITREYEVIATRGPQVFLKAEGKYYRDGADRVVIDDVSNIMEEGRVGRQRILGTMLAQEDLQGSMAAAEKKDVVDPMKTRARQVGKRGLKEGLECVMRITGVDDLIIKKVTVRMRLGGSILLETGSEEDAAYEVAIGATEKKELRMYKGVIPLSETLVRGNPAERGVTFWRPALSAP